MNSDADERQQTPRPYRGFFSIPGGFLGPLRLAFFLFMPFIVLSTILTFYVGPIRGDKVRGRFPSKTPLSEVRFVLCNEGRLFTELTEEYDKVLEPFVESDSDLALLDEGFMNTRLDRSIQDRVFASIREKAGDVYSVLLLDGFICRSNTLRGTAVISSGDGYRGFVGALDEYPRELTWRGSDRQVCGLSFKGTVGILGGIAPSKPSPRSDDDEIVREACSFLSLSNGHLQFTWDVYCRFPNDKGVLAVVRDNSTGNEFLQPMMKSGSTWLPLSMKRTTGEEYGNFEYLTANPQSGFYMTAPQLFVLPDIDGNGADEILVTSEIVNILFSIEPSSKTGETESGTAPYILREVRRLSFAV